MKVIDTVHNYPDGHGGLKRGLCRVRSFVVESRTIVLLTELDEKNDGMSISNAIERIVQSLEQIGLVIGPATYIEHYEKKDPPRDEFLIVKLSASGRTEWVPVDRQRVIELSGASLDELSDRSESNFRIVSRADYYRFSRDIFAGSPWQGTNSTIKRRIEIADSMVSKSEVELAIISGGNERDIQKLLKKDLSIFAEAYAQPSDEYICFSEFPLSNGVVDFVVFTGRSRMDVVLIEVKGADFNIINSSHYQDFNHKINQAASQMRDRVRAIYIDLEGFRDYVHDLRIRVENGEKIYNSFLGPVSTLEVDPKKDINIRTVLIGGRTVNDRTESAKRHDFERDTVPPVRVESWDTWLRRLRRQ